MIDKRALVQATVINLKPKPDNICLQETHLSGNDSFKLPGYTVPFYGPSRHTHFN